METNLTLYKIAIDVLLAYIYGIVIYAFVTFAEDIALSRLVYKELTIEADNLIGYETLFHVQRHSPLQYRLFKENLIKSLALSL